MVSDINKAEIILKKMKYINENRKNYIINKNNIKLKGKYNLLSNKILINFDE